MKKKDLNVQNNNKKKYNNSDFQSTISSFNLLTQNIQNIIKPIYQESTINLMIQSSNRLYDSLKPLAESLKEIYSNENIISMQNSLNLLSIQLSTMYEKINPIYLEYIENLCNNEFLANKTAINNILDAIEYIPTNIKNIKTNSNGDIIYNDIKVSERELESNTNEIIQKAATGTLGYEDIKRKPKLTISLLILFLILNNLISFILQDEYNSAKNYIKEKFLCGKEVLSNIDYNDFRIVVSDILNVRLSPSTNSEIIDKLYCFNVVKVIDKVPYWYKIEYEDDETGEKKEGWICKKYTKDFSDETESIFKLNN